MNPARESAPSNSSSLKFPTTTPAARAYYGAVRRFSAWCAAHRIEELSRVEPVHVAAWLKALEAEGCARAVPGRR
jgi:site-specific recombinase XerD